jgi:hypothetical protein
MSDGEHPHETRRASESVSEAIAKYVAGLKPLRPPMAAAMDRPRRRDMDPTF